MLPETVAELNEEADMPAYPSDLEAVVAFHRHLCPGVLIGYRASLIGLRELHADPAQDEELTAMVYTDSCAADAVQVLTGCTFGKGNLKFLDVGKHVFLFSKRGEEASIRVALRYAVLQNAGSREEAVQLLLEGPDEELYKVERVKAGVPSPAMIYPTIQCAFCGEGVMEPRARLREGKYACLECAEVTRCV
jgi:formylmethanofuran dehydrogenase subunit E